MGPAPGGEVETLLPCDEDVPELWGNSWGVTNSLTLTWVWSESSLITQGVWAFGDHLHFSGELTEVTQLGEGLA